MPCLSPYNLGQGILLYFKTVCKEDDVMYNSSYTKDFSNKLNISRKYKLVFDIDGKVLCGINKNSICDLNGEEIAKLRKKNT